MKLAFVLFKYFPFGGLQRDMLRVAHVCQARGHDIHVYCLTWDGDVPDGIEVHLLPIKRLTNHSKYESFYEELQTRLVQDGIEGVIGFNRMPGLDLYYAADACFKDKLSRRNSLLQLGSRYRHFLEYEKAVFGKESRTHVLLISPSQLENFVQYYGTPRERLHMLPPGIDRDRVVPANAGEVREQFRKEYKLADEERLLLAIGSGFKTKGLDRTLRAFHSLPTGLRGRTRLIAMGNDNPKHFIKMAKKLGLDGQFEIMSGRDDVPRFLQGGDLLVHPAYYENTGTVLLEALVAGLPVLTTESCGYAFHVKRSGGGQVLPSPFDQERFNQELLQMLDSPQREEWRRNGIAYGAAEDLYGMPELAADIILDQVSTK